MHNDPYTTVLNSVYCNQLFIRALYLRGKVSVFRLVSVLLLTVFRRWKDCTPGFSTVGEMFDTVVINAVTMSHIKSFLYCPVLYLVRQSSQHLCEVTIVRMFTHLWLKSGLSNIYITP